MPAKQVIVLTQATDGTTVTYTGLFWFPITKNPVAQTSGSVWNASGSSTGASSAESSAIQAGTIKEEPWSYSFPNSVSVAAIQAFLQQAWANRNAQIAGQGADQYYGSYWDGTTWGAQ